MVTNALLPFIELMESEMLEEVKGDKNRNSTEEERYFGPASCFKVVTVGVYHDTAAAEDSVATTLVYIEGPVHLVCTKSSILLDGGSVVNLVNPTRQGQRLGYTLGEEGSDLSV